MENSSKLYNFIEYNKISMKLERVARNPILAENSQDEGLGHYRCQLLSPGKRLAVYLSIRAEDQLLTLSDVLFLLALDATGCGMMGGFDTYRDKWNGMFGGMGCKPQEIEFFWEELEGRCRQTEALQEFLGESAYEELLSLFGLEEDRQAATP